MYKWKIFQMGICERGVDSQNSIIYLFNSLLQRCKYSTTDKFLLQFLLQLTVTNFYHPNIIIITIFYIHIHENICLWMMCNLRDI